MCATAEEPSTKVLTKKTGRLVTVPLDVSPELCTSTMLPNISTGRSLSDLERLSSFQVRTGREGEKFRSLYGHV